VGIAGDVGGVDVGFEGGPGAPLRKLRGEPTPGIVGRGADNIRPVNPLARVRFVLAKDLTLGTLFERLAAFHGDDRLVTEAGSDDLSYNAAAERVAAWAGAVAAKTEPGDRVVLALPNTYDLLLACLAVSRAGAIPVPVNDRMRPDEVDHVVDDSGAHLIVRDLADFAGGKPLAEAVPAQPGDSAALFYTSGTTGKPKGAELSHRSLIGSATFGGLNPERLIHPEAVVGLPIAHIMGFAALVGLGCGGIPVYFLPRFRPTDVLDALEDRKSALFIGVPAMYRMLWEAGAPDRDLSSVRLWISGADAMPADLAAEFRKLGTGLHLPLVGSIGDALFVEGYGMVETGGGAAMKLSAPVIGESLIPLPGYKFRVVDEQGDEVGVGSEGELWMKGPGVLKGYWGSPEATADAVTADGWLRTGDLVRRGVMGTATFAGRKKDVIMHGGYSVYALEVEHALEEHPDVHEASVVGLPDERKGAIPAAAVRVESGATLTPEQLIEWAGERLSPYKAPQRVLFVDDLPRTGTTKVQKKEVVVLFDAD